MWSQSSKAEVVACSLVGTLFISRILSILVRVLVLVAVKRIVWILVLVAFARRCYCPCAPIFDIGERVRVSR